MKKKHYYVIGLGLADYQDEVAIRINEEVSKGYQLQSVYSVGSNVYGVFWKLVKCRE